MKDNGKQLGSGEFLGGTRFRIRGRFATGEEHQIALLEDTERDDAYACGRVVMYDPAREREEVTAYVEQRRDLLRQQKAFLELEIGGFPEMLAWLEVEQSGGEEGSETEPVLVYDYVHGISLYEYVTREKHNGMEPAPAMTTLRKVVEVVDHMHRAGWIWRNPDPRHVLVDDEGDLVGLVGFGNCAPHNETGDGAAGEEGGDEKPAHRPNPTLLEAYAEAPYVAPEVRSERSGVMLRPQADIYGLGALLSFMVTGQEPTAKVEAPLKGPAYDRLMEMDPPGIAVLVAMCIQPTAKHRIQTASELIDYTMPGRLPDPEDEQVEMDRSDLPPPFSGADLKPSTRSLQSKLSAGPLISVPGESGEPPSREDEGFQPSQEAVDEGAMSDPVKEFLGENDEPPERIDLPDYEDDDQEHVVDDETGEPLREVSMAEKLADAGEDTGEESGEDAEDADKRPAEEGETAWERGEHRVMPEPAEGLPPFEELPRKWRLLIQVGLPALGVGVVLLLAWMGVI